MTFISSIEVREYERARKAEYRLKNPTKHLLTERARLKTKRAAARKIVWDHKLKHKCLDCGETDPVVLEFDHRDPSLKCFNIASQRNAALDPTKLLLEIKKCDVRCANCHRRKTAIERKHYNPRGSAL